MAVSFSISDVTASSFRVSVKGTNTSTYRYIRIFAKETSSGETVHDNKWIDSRGSNLSDNVTGLSANTSYTVNVSYNSTNSANGATWVGGKTVRTSSSSGGGGGSTDYYGTVTFTVGDGIAYANVAYIDSEGDRIPSSGYKKSYGGTYKDIEKFYVDTVSLEDGYEFPWKAIFGGRYTQGTNSDRTSGNTRDVHINIYPDSGKSASLELRATKKQGGNVSVNFGTGVSSLKIAYRDANGNRHPTTDGSYTTYSASQVFTDVEMVYVYRVSFDSPYGLPWSASYGGSYTSDTSTDRTSGSTNEVNALIYPASGSSARFTISGTISYSYYAYWFDLKYSKSTPYQTNKKENVGNEKYSFWAPNISRTGYTLEGWCISASGDNGTGSIIVEDGEAITLPYNNQRSITLYARWLAHTYNISFYANGGSGTMNSITNCTYGTAYTLPKNQFTRNYTITLNYNYDNKKVTKNAECPFLYWSYNNNTYADQATVKNLADSGTATLYAQWGDYSVELPTLIRSGYVFLGWFTSATGGSQVSSPATGKSDRTLYAHWKEDVISPTISNVSHTDTTITISLNRNNATTGSWIIEASLSNFGTVVYNTTITSTTQTTITLTGLTPETTYYIRARHVNGGVSASSNVISATTRTSTFQWTSNDSVYVIKSAVFTDAITAAKWNELIEKVNWCRRRKGLSTVLLNDAIRGQPILATNFNDMRDAIADMHTVTPARSAGDEILATYFANSDTSLKSAINAVITTL